MDEQKTNHPAFAQISLHRINGHQNLYGVDFPQGHFMEIKISHSEHVRSISNDWFREGDLIVSVAMSETQWAQLLCSPNTSGVPCTLDYIPEYTRLKKVPPIEDHDVGAKGDLHKNEFKQTAKDAISAVSRARSKLESILAEKTPNKTELRAILADLETAEREAIANLPFVIDMAGEAIEKAKTAAKGELEAYAGMTLRRLGERALAVHISQGGKLEKLEDETPRASKGVESSHD